jgi:hypothetical protein
MISFAMRWQMVSAARVHQGRLDGAGHFSDPGLVVTAFDKVDFGERHAAAATRVLMSFRGASRVSFDRPSMKVRSRIIRSSV